MHLDNSNPLSTTRIVISYYWGSSGTFIGNMFMYLIHDVPLSLNRSNGDALNIHAILHMGPEWVIDPATISSINTILGIKEQQNTGSKITSLSDEKRQAVYNMFLARQEFAISNALLVDRTHITDYNFLTKWYEKSAFQPRIISITIDSIEELQKALQHYLNKSGADKSTATATVTLLYLERLKSEQSTCPESHRIPFSAILNQDVEFIHHFILNTCAELNISVSVYQKIQIKQYIRNYFSRQVKI